MRKPTRTEAENAIRTLLRWVGENPDREGLERTPTRVVNAYLEYCRGYTQDPRTILERTFGETDNYEEMVLLRDIRFESMCEHHLAPVIGKVHVAYLPNKRVVGISKIARLVDAYGRRLQIQERFTAQIADNIDQALKPRGVAVAVEASHHCLCARGVHKPGTVMVTSAMRGAFLADPSTRQEFFHLIRTQNG